TTLKGARKQAISMDPNGEYPDTKKVRTATHAPVAQPHRLNRNLIISKIIQSSFSSCRSSVPRTILQASCPHTGCHRFRATGPIELLPSQVNPRKRCANFHNEPGPEGNQESV